MIPVALLATLALKLTQLQRELYSSVPQNGPLDRLHEIDQGVAAHVLTANYFGVHSDLIDLFRN